MESCKVNLRWRKESLKQIETKRNDREAWLEGIPEEEPLSPSAYLFNEPNFNVHVVAILGTKSRLSLQLIKEKLPHTLLKHSRFSSFQALDEKKGEMKWVRTKVDLEKHVVVVSPDTIEMGDDDDEFVEKYIEKLSKSSLEKSRPLWDLHLLNAKTSDGADGVVVFRIHHSLGDGTSLMSLLLACTRQAAKPNELPTIPIKNRKSKSKPKSNNKTKFLLAALWYFFEMIKNTVVDVVMFGVTALFLKDTETPIKAPPGSEFSPRRIVHRSVSLDDIKFVKNTLQDMTINDVALGIIQAGLSLYLNRRYAEEGKKDMGATQKRNNLPKNIRLRSTLLVNLRPTAGIQALADMMEKDTEVKWGNWIGFIIFPFTIGLRDNPLDYVRQAKATIDRKKRSLEAVYTFSISELVVRFFGIKRASALSHKIITNTTMCFSNLVGPQEEIGFYGHPITYVAPGSYGQPHGLMMNFQSYANKMTMVLSVDETVIPDPHRLLNDLEDALNLIKDAALALQTLN